MNITWKNWTKKMFLDTKHSLGEHIFLFLVLQILQRPQKEYVFQFKRIKLKDYVRSCAILNHLRIFFYELRKGTWYLNLRTSQQHDVSFTTCQRHAPDVPGSKNYLFKIYYCAKRTLKYHLGWKLINKNRMKIKQTDYDRCTKK